MRTDEDTQIEMNEAIAEAIYQLASQFDVTRADREQVKQLEKDVRHALYVWLSTAYRVNHD